MQNQQNRSPLNRAVLVKGVEANELSQFICAEQEGNINASIQFSARVNEINQYQHYQYMCATYCVVCVPLQFEYECFIFLFVSQLVREKR